MSASRNPALASRGGNAGIGTLAWLGAGLFLALTVLAPFTVGNYWVRILTSIYMYAVVAQGLNVIVGFAGYHAFGNSVFFGVGAYTVGVAMTLGLPFAAALPLAIVVSALAAAVLGWPLLRLRGHYFAIATVALNMAMNDVIINVGGVTGGAQGLPLPLDDMSPEALGKLIYFIMLAAMLAATGIVHWLTRSPLGYALRALRDSEQGAEVMGIDTTLAKIVAWSISAAMTGAAGGVWGYWINFIEPGSAFDIGISVQGYIMMIMGGMGTVLGPLIGAFFLETISTVLWGQFMKAHLLILGVLIIVIVMVIPEGLLSYARRLLRLRQGTR
jgi:branched-chain amino acid transport system permease protein